MQAASSTKQRDMSDQDHPATIGLLQDKKVDATQLITGRIGLDDLVSKGFRELIDNKEENVKILVSPKAFA